MLNILASRCSTRNNNILRSNSEEKKKIEYNQFNDFVNIIIIPSTIPLRYRQVYHVGKISRYLDAIAVVLKGLGPAHLKVIKEAGLKGKHISKLMIIFTYLYAKRSSLSNNYSPCFKGINELQNINKQENNLAFQGLAICLIAPYSQVVTKSLVR